MVGVFPGAAGLECEWQSIFGNDNKGFILLSCITLPWAARIKIFGQIVELLESKNKIEACLYGDITTSSDDEKEKENVDKSVYIKQFENIIGPSTKLIDYGHILGMTLGAMSAVAHPAIMYDKWSNWDNKPLSEKPLFYQGVTESSGDKMDKLSDECIKIAKNVELQTGLKLNVPKLYDWFLQCYGDNS